MIFSSERASGPAFAAEALKVVEAARHAVIEITQKQYFIDVRLARVVLSVWVLQLRSDDATATRSPCRTSLSPWRRPCNNAAQPLWSSESSKFDRHLLVVSTSVITIYENPGIKLARRKSGWYVSAIPLCRAQGGTRLIQASIERTVRNMEMQRSGRLVSASVIAPLVPVLMFVSLNRDIGGRFVIGALIVSYLHSSVGIAIFLWLRRGGGLSLGTIVMVSALIGAIPITILTLSIGLPNFESVGGLVIVQDGRLTISGYLEIVRQALSAGGLGACAGVVWHSILGLRPL
jgi:hypothetical protein